MSDNKELDSIWKKLDEMQDSHVKSIGRVTDSLDGFSIAMASLDKTVALVGADLANHKKDHDLPMIRHEKDHEKGWTWLRGISAAIALIIVIGGIGGGAVFVLKLLP